MGKKTLDLKQLVRSNILSLEPYRCARDDYDSGILLDANENALGHSLASASLNGAADGIEADGIDVDHLSLHRYPDPRQMEIKRRVAELRGVSEQAGGADAVFLGVGSDEIIDLVMRVTCTPGKDPIVVAPPTYGMYSVCAVINDVPLVKVPLIVEGGRFTPDVPALKAALDAKPAPKLLFLTSPGNPTGTLIPLDDIRALLDHPGWNGLVVVDEAYIDFSPPESSAVSLLNEGYQNLIVMQTLSKGFGLAGIRLGISIAAPAFTQILSNTKAPYNISTPTASLALRALQPESLELLRQKTTELKESRTWLANELRKLDGLAPAIGQPHANFLLVPVLSRSGDKPDSARAATIYKQMAEHRGLVVRYRGNEVGCAGCLRITIGTKDENRAVVDRIRQALVDF